MWVQTKADPVKMAIDNLCPSKGPTKPHLEEVVILLNK